MLNFSEEQGYGVGDMAVVTDDPKKMDEASIGVKHKWTVTLDELL